MTKNYDAKFYENIGPGSERSAEIVLPLLLSEIRPKSLVDIGCGTGAWLAVAKKNGVSDVLGLDGTHANVNLQIDPNEFRETDVNERFLLDKKYDLALCLEVGEHILTRNAPILVDSLTKAADIILFSAGIPGQGGMNHINEQWPDFWRNLFENSDFVCIDCIRPLIYNNIDVEWWYRQNLLLYVNRKVLKEFPRLETQQDRANDIVLLHKSLLKKRYGFARCLLYFFEYPITTMLYKLGFRR